MAIIDKKFIHFKNYDDFISQAGVGSVANITTPTSGSEDTRNAVYGQIKGSSIVFIKDTKQIWTHGQLYSCNVDASHALWVDENNVVNRDSLKIGTFELVSGEYYYMLEIQEMNHPWYSSISNVVAEFTGNYLSWCDRDSESGEIIFDESNIGLEFQVISYEGDPEGDAPQTLFVKLPTKWDSDTTTRPLICVEYTTDGAELHDGDYWACASEMFINPEGWEEYRLMASVSRQLITPYREYATHAYLNNERVAVKSDIPNDILTAPNGRVHSDDLHFSTINTSVINLTEARYSPTFTYKTWNGSDGQTYTFDLNDYGITAKAISDWGKIISFRIDYNGVQINGEQVATLPQVSAGFVKQITNVTYQELVQLRNNSQLIPGAMYRITDYETKLSEYSEDTGSGWEPEHVLWGPGFYMPAVDMSLDLKKYYFDIVVVALSPNEISEQAYAVRSSRDVEGHFTNRNLSAWKVYYRLENKHDFWPVPKTAKGVIYKLINEYGNESPFDFENVYYGHRPVFGSNCTNNILEGYYITLGPNCHDNYIGKNSVRIEIGDNSSGNTFGVECRGIVLGSYCNYNTFGNNCEYFYDKSYGTFGGGFWINESTPRNYCSHNTFANGCAPHLECSASANASSKLQHLCILTNSHSYWDESGCNLEPELKYSAAISLPIDIINAASEIRVGANSQGKIRIYRLEDLIN